MRGGPAGNGDFFQGQAAQFSKHCCNAWQFDWRVAAPVKPDRRDIGSVGFEDDGFERQTGRKFPDARRARESHGAAKAELEPETDQFFGLLPAAIEGVGNATAYSRPAQIFESLIDSPAQMQEDGQIQAAGKIQLSGEEALLPVQIASWDKEV